MRASPMLTRCGGLFACLLAVIASGCAGQPQKQADALAPVREVKPLEPASGGRLVPIPAGSFAMGDAQGEPDETPHTVTVDAFYIDVQPVTQALFQRVMGSNPSKKKGDSLPVTRVQWTAAAEFCNRCSELDGLTPCYDLQTWSCNFAADGYRLPTEAEWEYACRAGSRTRYSYGDDPGEMVKHGWCKPHSKGRVQPVGRKLPNRWGLLDMHGNVWEWCQDRYAADYYQQSPQKNPTGPAEGKKRVLRGGAWNSPPERCRSAARFSEFQVFSDACFGADSYGFRRVRRGLTGSPKNPAATAATVASTSQSTSKADPAKDSANPATAHTAEVANAGSKKPQNAAQSPSATAPADNSSSPAPENKNPEKRKRLSGSIVFVSDRGGGLDLWRMEARSGALRQLTHDAHPDADPRFSPQGDRLLFTSVRDGFPRVFVMPAEGGRAMQITDGSQASWSPDGKAIIFIRDDQAFVRNLESGKEHRVTPEPWRRCGVPSWRPDGKQVAVASRHLARIGIFLLGPQGGSVTPLKTEDACCTPQWSPDGQRMVFQTDKGHIHLYYTDDQSEEQVTFGADIQHDARFSPDGNWIVFARAATEDGPWQLWVTDLEDDDLKSFALTGRGSNRQPDWSHGKSPPK